MLRRWRVKRSGGIYRLNLSAEERQVLGSLCDQLRELLATPPEAHDERVRRLFPTAYPDDPERDAEYARFMHSELVESRLASIAMLEESLQATELTEGQLMGWMRAVNSVRLVLGTMLDVSEESDMYDLEPEDPDFGHYALYGYLSVLLEEIVGALS